MKKLFPGYYRPTENEFKELWNTSIFVLDANVLLNLYRYTRDTRERLLGILKDLKNRLWLPHQVALEFHRNRLKVVADQFDAYKKVTEIFSKQAKDLERELTNYKRHPLIRVDALLDSCSKAFQNAVSTLGIQAKDHPDFSKNDIILDAITSLFDGRVGNPFLEEELSKIYKEGQARYEKERPPGYLDPKSKSGDERFGDFVLWKQLLNHASTEQKSIILVTDDVKDDWWRRSQGKIIGPRPELIAELRDYSGQSFYMYQTDQFMEMSNRYMREQVSPQVLDEVREVSRREDAVRRVAQAIVSREQRDSLAKERDLLVIQEAELKEQLRQTEDELESATAFQPISTDDAQARDSALLRAMERRISLTRQLDIVRSKITRTSQNLVLKQHELDIDWTWPSRA